MAEELLINKSATKEEKYQSLIPQIEALTYGETDLIANLSNIAAALKQTGFSVVSFASNHCMEDGVEAFLETIDTLRLEGCHVIGCGRTVKKF